MGTQVGLVAETSEYLDKVGPSWVLCLQHPVPYPCKVRFLPTGAQQCWPCYWFRSWTPKAQGKPSWGSLHLPRGGTYTGKLPYLGWKLLVLRGRGEKNVQGPQLPLLSSKPFPEGQGDTGRQGRHRKATSASNLLSPPCLTPGGHSWRTGVLGSECQWLSTSPEGRQSGAPMGSTQHYPEIDLP